MNLLDRLAHARSVPAGSTSASRPGAAPPLLTRAPPARPASPAVAGDLAESASPRPFDRHEQSLPLAPEPTSAGPRGYAQVRSGVRETLLGGCLARLPLPSGPELARDLVCLGAPTSSGRVGAGAGPVFLDTETTGLGGVAIAFVVGLAWIDGAHLRCVQWTLGQISGEAALLADVFATLEALGPAPLVSFNGASFDLPLLRLRAKRHGLTARSLDAAHVDLLHPARRLHRRRVGDCKLGTLERTLLAVDRRGDLDSACIPEIFWTWLASPHDLGAQRRLAAVREHNLVDLVSLPALASRLAAGIREPGDLDRALRAARHLERIGAHEQARLVLGRWVTSTDSRRAGPWREAALELASFERRAGEPERAAALWRAAWQADPGCPDACEAWAKHLEHRLGDHAQALRVARGSRQPCERRIARLEARLARMRTDAPATPPAGGTAAATGPRALPRDAVARRDTPTRPTVEREVAAVGLGSGVGSGAGASPPRSQELLTRVDQTCDGAVVRYRLLR